MTKTAKTPKALTGAECKRLRTKSKKTQAQFWTAVGVTQCAGSRYEEARNPLPKPVQHLVRLIHAPDGHAYLATLRGEPAGA